MILRLCAVAVRWRPQALSLRHLDRRAVVLRDRSGDGGYGDRDARHQAVDAYIVLTFSEAVQRGTSNIVLNTAACAVVDTYDAAYSTNPSISRSATCEARP